MIRSMTGYGAAQRSEESVSYSLELRSLNNRYFKASIRLPEHLQFLEGEVDKLLRSRLSRGTVNYLLRVKDESARSAYVVNSAALQSYVDQIGRIEPTGGASVTLDLAMLSALPGVCQPPDLGEQEREHYWEIIRSLTIEAMEALIQMRQREGEALRNDLRSHCQAMRQDLADIAALAPTVVEEYRQKLHDRVNVLLASAEMSVQQESLMREVALFADRCDISEEVARLTSHLDQFVQLCDRPESAGRKLDFLAQEMLREANTIGSKSNNAAITRHVVDVKTSIDRLKEQVQNVE